MGRKRRVHIVERAGGPALCGQQFGSQGTLQHWHPLNDPEVVAQHPETCNNCRLALAALRRPGSSPIS